MALQRQNSGVEPADLTYIAVQDDSKLEKSDVEYTGYADIPVTKVSPYAVKSPHLRECLAEFFGMFVLLSFGMGVNNQVSLSEDTRGTFMSINLCWGIAVMLGVHIAGGVSGAHLNPAVTIAFAVYKRIAWRKVPGYIVAQMLGAFCAAFMIFMMYRPLINNADPNHTTQQVHFATYPRDLVPNTTAFYTEFFGAAMLLIGVFAVEDKCNKPGSKFTAPIAFCLLITAIGMAFGMNTGYAINPARDFGPRFFTFLAGWGSMVFTKRDYYFWIPLVAPVLGCIAGGGLYKLFIEIHHPHPDASQTSSEV
ncbi:TPA: hypothetical protein N0F65_007821 [Lagenidium giganteum]|uniref:Aquaporin n=1 Tax=Lagenidium giganteum TaxID=4803 RepID=A0AAV2Z1L2_9STRA|nr:TPA: hypothetical protein N0F65_007821 [Lagenidium giganteum]